MPWFGAGCCGVAGVPCEYCLGNRAPPEFLLDLSNVVNNPPPPYCSGCPNLDGEYIVSAQPTQCTYYAFFLGPFVTCDGGHSPFPWINWNVGISLQSSQYRIQAVLTSDTGNDTKIVVWQKFLDDKPECTKLDGLQLPFVSYIGPEIPGYEACGFADSILTITSVPLSP